MTDQNVSSYEERILAAAIKLAEAADDPAASSLAVREIVHCARGILRRAPRDPEDDIEQRRRSITMVDVPGIDFSLESRVEYDADEKAWRLLKRREGRVETITLPDDADGGER